MTDNPTAGDEATGETGGAAGFQVHLDVFEGPFDLLLALISKHKLDITEVALSQVTDEFIGYIRALADGWDLDQASYFLVVAATLLDLKAARLLPAGEVEDEEDLALLEARDLLFARLLQYRAYKEVAAVFAGRMAAAARRFPRRVPLEPRFASPAARGAARPRAGRVRPDRGDHARAQAAAGGVDRAHPLPAHQRPRAGRRSSAGRLRRLGRATFRGLIVGLPPGRTRWWPGSWPCWTSTVKARCPSSRWPRSASCTSPGPVDARRYQRDRS